MAGELESFDALPPDLVDGYVAWGFVRNGAARGRDAALGALWNNHGIGGDAAARMVDAAIARSHTWTREQAQALERRSGSRQAASW